MYFNMPLFIGTLVTGLELVTHVLNKSVAQRGDWDKADSFVSLQPHPFGNYLTEFAFSYFPRATEVKDNFFFISLDP